MSHTTDKKGNILVKNRQAQSVKINSGKSIRIISAEDIAALIDMKEAVGLIGNAFSSITNGHCHIPLRSVIENPDKTVTLFLKPAFDDNLSNFSIKIITQNDKNRARGLPSISGIVILLDAETSEIVALIDGNYITSLRTGAVGGLGAKFLSRDVESNLAIFGCGAQGRTQMRAVMAVRDIKKVFLFDTDLSAIESFIEEMQADTEIPLILCNDLDALKEVDIISTATNALNPLFRLEHLKPGVHINAIGSYKPNMQEIDPDVIKASSLFVDQREACLTEPGDIIKPLKDGLISKDHIKAEIGEVILGSANGRSSENEITVFKSVGLAIQDLYVANEIYSRLCQ